MKKNKYKILILSDLGKSTDNILKSTANLAKMIDGEITFFHVKQPLRVVKQDNQLSAVRSINSTYVSTIKRIEGLVNPVSETYGVKIDSAFYVGNVKEEIHKHIREYCPDIIVMGQRKQVPLKLIGDSITQFVLSNFDGMVMIASHDHVLETDRELSLGMFNTTKDSLKTTLAEKLLHSTSQPLKSFKISDNKTITEQANPENDDKIVEYVFEQSDTVMDNMSKYLSRAKVDVLIIDREKIAQNKTNIKNVIRKFNVPMMLTGKPNLQV